MQVQACLFFDGRCEEAIEFYRRTLGAEVSQMIRYKDSPGGCPAHITPAMEDKIMHVSFRIGETHLMAGDGKVNNKPEFKGITLAIDTTSDAETRRLFDALGEGGSVEMALEKTFWASLFGGVKDRFGVSWFVMTAAQK